MSPRVDGLRLAVAFLRHRVAQVSVLLLLGFLLGGTVIGLAVARDSAEQAILDSVRADLGQKAYALQTGDADANKALPAAVGAMPVQDEMGDVLAGGLSTPVLVRSINDPSLELGVVVRGARPKQAGEVLLSEVTAESLGVEIGDTVRVRAGDVAAPGRVVGFSVDPADRTTSTLVQLVDDSTEFGPTMWLSNSDFYTDPALRPILDRRTAKYQSVSTLLEAAAANRPHFLSAMGFLPVGCGLLVGILLVAVGAVLSRRWRIDVAALVAAGMSPSLAWRRILSVAFGTVLAGEIIGGIAAVLALWLSRDPVSAWVGQYWVGVAIPWQELAVVLGVTVLAALSAVPLVGLAGQWAQRLTPRPARRRWATAAGALAAGGGLVVWLVLINVSLQQNGDSAATFTPLAAAIIAAATPFAIGPALCWGLPTATRALMRQLLAGLRPVTAVGAIIVLSSSIWSAQTTYEANSGEARESPLVPTSSFVISEMPDAAIPTLTALYRSYGGKEVVRFGVPVESAARLRVTATTVTTCMSVRRTMNPDDVPHDCVPEDSTAPLNTVFFGPPGSTPRADPSLLENGVVGLLLFTSDDGSASRVADTRAQADSMLGGNLPGLVIPPDSDVAKEFRLIPSGSSEVVLLDFSELTPHDQLLIRAAAMRLAPSAQTASGTDPTGYDRLRSVADTVSFLGAATTMIIVLLGGIALVVAHTLTRRTLVDIGSTPRRRWGIVARWTAVPLLTALLTIPLAILTASFGGQVTDASYGTLWILPGAAGAVASLIVGLAFLRTPPTTSE